MESISGKGFILLPKLKGYDIVQIVNPCFLHLKPEKSLPIYRFLRKHNKKIFLGAFGTDHYYVKNLYGNECIQIF